MKQKLLLLLTLLVLCVTGAWGDDCTTLVSFATSQHQTSSPRKVYGYTSTEMTEASRIELTCNNSNTKGQNDGAEIRLDYGQYLQIPSQTSVTSVTIDYKFYNSGNTKRTCNLKVAVGSTEKQVEISGLNSDGYKTAEFTFSPAVTGTITITNMGSGNSNMNLYLDNITYCTASASYTVTYNNNGGTGTIANSNGASITLSDGTGFTAPTGYSFAGWNTANDGSGTSYTASQSGITTNLDLFATWTQGASINANTGSANTTYTATLNATSIAVAAAPTKEGNSLTGYWTAASEGVKVANADGSLVANTSYADANSKWNNSGDAPSLFAQWESATYTVTVAKNNDSYGAVSASSVTGVEYNTSISAEGATLTVGETNVTATAAANTDEYTYAFNNWTGIPEGGKVTDNVTVTANFTRTPVDYTLSWNKNAEDADDLTGTYTSGTVAFGTAITAPNTPTRTGYTFQGWAESADGDVVEVPATMPAVDKTYYAKWEVYVAPTAGVIYSLTFVNSSKQTMSDGDNLNLTSTYAKITGGSAMISYFRSGNTNKEVLTSSNEISYGTNDMYLKLELNDPLQAGDVISFANGSGVELNIATTAGTPKDQSSKVVTDSYKYTVVGNDVLDGASVLYIGRSDATTTKHKVVTVTRKNSITLNNVTSAEYGFSTFCSPNNFTVSGATAYKASLSDNTLTLTALSGIIPADEGVILAGTTGATVNIAYTTSDATADMTGNKLHGTTARTLTSTLKGSANKFMAFQNTTNTFKEYTGTYFPANKAYILLDGEGTATARELSMIFDNGETTGINLNANDNLNSNAPMYNLAGQRVTESYKGVVIQNGKKYVRK